MNYPDFDRSLVRQRNEEMLREVQRIRLEQELKASRSLHPKRSDANRSIWMKVLPLFRSLRVWQ